METQWIDRPVEDCFHVCSDGTVSSVLFETEEDKIFGMNQLAITAWKYGCSVLCPVVMDTHFHVIVRGRKEAVGKYRSEIARVLILYFHRTGRDVVIDVEIIDILSERELMSQIIYVFRNPMEAGYPFLPENYRWGAGRVFFQEKEEAGTPLSQFSVRQIRSLVHTRAELPGHWSVDDSGMLVPSSFMDVKYVLRLFKTPRVFLAFLFVRKKDLAEWDARCGLPFVEKRDEKKMRETAREQAETMFGKRIRQLSTAERILLAKDLWSRNITYSKKQLARLVGLDPSIIESVFQ